jgi:hypothetical protein
MVDVCMCVLFVCCGVVLASGRGEVDGRCQYYAMERDSAIFSVCVVDKVRGRAMLLLSLTAASGRQQTLLFLHGRMEGGRWKVHRDDGIGRALDQFERLAGFH